MLYKILAIFLAAVCLTLAPAQRWTREYGEEIVAGDSLCALQCMVLTERSKHVVSIFVHVGTMLEWGKS
jgi:hypothetical protein